MKLDQLNKNLILNECKKIKVPGKITEQDLINSFQISTFLSPVLLKHFKEIENNNKLSWSKQEYKETTQKVMNEFVCDVLPQLIEIKKTPISDSEVNDNIFTAAKCEYLSKSNKYTRKISTVLGNYLEQVVDCSPRTFSTESEFEGLKIKGIDTIIYNNGKLIFTQLKTKQDTLTGSQSPRSIAELSIFENSLFAAQFSLGNWTFSPGTTGIKRVSGKDFWSLIDVDYEDIKNIVFTSIRQIEDKLFD
jgi:hypothetical protein